MLDSNKMWRLIFYLSCIFIFKISAQDVGEECVPNNEVFDGVCTIVTDCEVAVSELRRNKFHSYQRCGFYQKLEVICCPRTTQKFGNNNRKMERKADQECKNITQSTLTPLNLHIIGGEVASLGEYPHMVAVGYDRGNGYQFDCGGALVSSTYVLTAAHCIYNLERIEPTMIRAGVVELGDSTWNEKADYKIAQVIAHPDYVRSTKYHDLALLRLEKPVSVSNNLNAACLYTEDSDPDTPMTITGWGRISSTQNIRSDTLLQTKVVAMSREQCNPMYTNWRKLPKGITNEQICAGDPQGGHDACQGDSGGPLQFIGQDSQYRLVGITSFGSGCGTTKPGVYTRVSHYLDWIESVVWPN